MSKHDLTVDDVAKEMCMSRSVLSKKVKEITEMTPNKYKSYKTPKGCRIINSRRIQDQ
ncbi:AraC family transcriptional regulator [Bacteroides caccae]|uniref:AraC family transcriptional regulator n=1 Tax=Bacteroides caccae TaxID=47678 RepID=UPI003AF29F68